MHLHANSADEVFDRIVQLVLKANPPLPTEWALRAATALDLVVHVRPQPRTTNGSSARSSKCAPVSSASAASRW